MNTREFVVGLRKQVIQSNVDIYRSLFEEAQAADAKDDYWKDALSLYASLDPARKETLFRVVRQVMVDTVSNVFAILDGASYIDSQHEDLDLSCAGDRLNGELQDIFLQIEEDAE